MEIRVELGSCGSGRTMVPDKIVSALQRETEYYNIRMFHYVYTYIEMHAKIGGGGSRAIY